MMYPESDSAFHYYHQWCLEQEARWQEEQQELEELEELEAPRGWTHWETSHD